MTWFNHRARSACTNGVRARNLNLNSQLDGSHLEGSHLNTRLMAHAVAGACALIGGMNMAYAQTPADVPEVVVTAARSEQIVTDALPSTTVITRADIEKSPVSDVVSLLKMQAGVVIRQYGAQGKTVSVNIRGGDPRHTLVLIDGVPMNSLSAGTGALEQIPLASIERVEIVRGNVSALYGSQATGGVVQVFTRKVGSGQEATIRLAVGSHGQRQASAQVRGGSDTVQATFGISHDEEKSTSAQSPTSAYSKVNPDKDGYKNNSANGSVRYRPNANNEFGLKFFDSRGKSNYDYAYASSTSALQYNETRVQNISLYANNRLTDNWKSSLRVSQYTDRTDDYDSAPTWTDGHSLYKARSKEVSWQNDVHTRAGDFIVGISRTQQRLTSDSKYSNTGRGTTSIWAGYMLDKARHHLQLNARTDKLSSMSRENTAAINYGFDLNTNWRVLAGYSNGFSAPTLNDLYSAYGNPNLKAEYSNYGQIGVQYTDGTYTSRLTAFENRYRNKIAYDSVTWTVGNIARAKVRGVEWMGSYSRNGWSADVGLTYQEVKNRDTGARLLRQPRVLASIGLGKVWGKWTTQLNWQSQGDMKDTSNSIVSGYGVLNVAAYYAVSKEVKVGLTLGNVFNRKYETLHGYNSTPRNVLLSLQYQPKW